MLYLKESEKSALAELRSATGGLQAVLLSFFHSGVAGHETGSLQSGAVLGIQSDQGTGNAVTDGTGLTGNAAASNGNNDVDLAHQIGSSQRLTNDQLQGLQAELFVDVTAIDGDGAGAVLVDADTGDAGITTASAVKILLLALVHSMLPPISPESRLRASGRHEDARRPCTGADESCSCGPGCSWAACP